MACGGGHEVGRRRAAAIAVGLLAVMSLATLGAPTVVRAEKPPATRNTPWVQCDRYYARYRQGDEGSILLVSFRLRAMTESPIPARVVVVARTGEGNGEAQSADVWPREARDAVTRTGFLYRTAPQIGHAIDLGPRWQRINATFPVTHYGQYDVATVYVLAPSGGIRFARSFLVGK